MASNTTAAVPFFSDDAALSHYVHSVPQPFYYTTRPQVLSTMSDETLALVAPLAAYWIYSGFFQLLDSLPSHWLDRYRIHESEEMKARNLASKWDVLVAVLFQQVVQTLLGWIWMGAEEVNNTRLADERWIRDVVLACAQFVLGKDGPAEIVLRVYGPATVRFLYWWGIPLAQLGFAMYVSFYFRAFLYNLTGIFNLQVRD